MRQAVAPVPARWSSPPSSCAGRSRGWVTPSCSPPPYGSGCTTGSSPPGLPAPSLAVWKGDQVAACVAAASIVAKVTRDRLMASLDEEFPQYGFADHKGYVTPQHRLALETYGPCPHHRYSFVTVARGMGENELGAGVA